MPKGYEAYQRNRGRAIKAGTWFPMYCRKTTPKAAISPTARDLEWAAGFLEGEGSFTMGKPGQRIGQRVMAVQVNPEPLLRLQRLFGGGFSPIRRQRSEQQEAFAWRVCGARARGVMMTLYLLLSQRRREQIRVALSGMVEGRPKRAQRSLSQDIQILARL